MPQRAFSFDTYINVTGFILWNRFGAVDQENLVHLLLGSGKVTDSGQRSRVNNILKEKKVFSTVETCYKEVGYNKTIL